MQQFSIGRPGTASKCSMSASTFPSEAASGLQCSVWPVIAKDGRSEALGIEIRESSPPDPALDLQRQIAEQMLLSALRERGFAEDAEAARRRAAFLAEAGRVLAESVDQSSTLVALTRLALPSLGAWCIVDILEDANAIHRLGIYHPDPEKQELAHELQASWAPESDDPFGAPAMLRDSRTVAITDDIEATLAATAHSPANLHILRQLGIGSLLTVPLVARNRLLGAITFVSAEHRASRTGRKTFSSPKTSPTGARLPSTMRRYTTSRSCSSGAPKPRTGRRRRSSAR